MFKITLFMALILLLTSSAIAEQKQAAQATIVQTVEVTMGSLIAYQSFIGTLYYSESSIVASQVAGLALKVNFDTTQQINNGQILAELDHEILDSKISAINASIKEVRLQLEKVNKDQQRYAQLLKQKNVSQQQYDEIYYNKTTLEQKLIALSAQLDSLTIERKQNLIRAPFSGMITKKDISPGEWVEKGGAIATLVNPHKIYVLFDISAEYASEMDLDKPIEVSINQKTYTAHIEGLIIQGDTKTRTIPLKIKLDQVDQFLFGGMEAEIKLARNTQEESLILPRDALIKRFGQDVVFIIEKGKAKMIPVLVKLYNGSKVAVTATGLSPQMRVISKGNERVFPDQAVSEK